MNKQEKLDKMNKELIKKEKRIMKLKIQLDKLEGAVIGTYSHYLYTLSQDI